MARAADLDEQLDVFTHHPPEHRREPTHDVTQVEHARLEHLLTSECQQLAGERRRLLRRRTDEVERCGQRWVARAEQLRASDDHGQKIVEVVRDAGRQPPDRLQLL